MMETADRPYVRCRECRQFYYLELNVIRKGPLECMYIECPHCGSRITVSITDTKLRQMQKRLHSAVRPATKQKNKEKIQQRMGMLARAFPLEKFLDPAWNPGGKKK